MRRTLRFAFVSAVLVTAAASGALLAQPKPLQSQETNVQGVSADLESAVVHEGVLTVKLRFRNAGAKKVEVDVIDTPGDIDKYYVVVGKTKLLPLRDSEKVPLMSALDSAGLIRRDVQPSSSYLLWIKFPAPPAGTSKMSFYTPQTPPFEDVPLTEVK
jgi:hypothetical protein